MILIKVKICSKCYKKDLFIWPKTVILLSTVFDLMFKPSGVLDL